jgi:hypothetical protein
MAKMGIAKARRVVHNNNNNNKGSFIPLQE